MLSTGYVTPGNFNFAGRYVMLALQPSYPRATQINFYITCHVTFGSIAMISSNYITRRDLPNLAMQFRSQKVRYRGRCLRNFSRCAFLSVSNNFPTIAPNNAYTIENNKSFQIPNDFCNQSCWVPLVSKSL